MGELATWAKDCCRPCYVALKRLTEGEIQKYTSVNDSDKQDKAERQQKKIAKNYLRDVSRVDFEMFENYKQSRQKYLKRKSQQSSTEMLEFVGFTSDETGASDEEYDGGASGSSSQSRRKKRLAYEDDAEWNPNSDSKNNHIERHSLRKPQQLGLRVNTRRKRIESTSSSSSDEDLLDYYDSKYHSKKGSNTEKTINPVPADQIYDPVKSISSTTESSKKKPSSSHIKKPVSKQSDDQNMALLDNDVLSKIMQEMEDFSNKNKKQICKTGENNRVVVHHSNTDLNHHPKVKKRQSRVFKITDEGLTPSVDSVHNVIKGILDFVCSAEKERLADIEESKKRKCKWCESPFPNRYGNHELCAICRDVVKLSSKSAVKNTKKAKHSGVGTAKGGSAKSKIKSKLFQNLPKYDQQRLAYSGKAGKSSLEKGYNHCKSFITPNDHNNDLSIPARNSEVEPGRKSPVTLNSKKTKVKKRKKLTNDMDPSPESKVIRKKKKIQPAFKTAADLTNSTIQTSVSQKVGKDIQKNQKHISVTNVDKGLFLMTFPDPHQELEIPTNLLEVKSSSVSDKNVAADKPAATASSLQMQVDSPQNKPKQPVINNVQYGTYLLPPVPTVVVANYATTDAKSGDYYLSSVYYQNEMTRSKNVSLRNDTVVTATNSVSLPSMPSIDQLSHISPSASSVPQTFHLNSLSKTNTEFNIANNVDVPNTVLVNQQMISNANISASAFSPQRGMGNIFNNSPLSISRVPYQNPSVIPESNILPLFDNSQFSVESLPLETSDTTFDSFENSDISAPLQNNSILLTQDYTEDSLSAPIKDSVLNNSNDTNLDSVMLDRTAQTKQSDLSDNFDTNQDFNKVSEQNLDPNLSGSAPSNNQNTYQSEIQNLSSEDLLDYCSAELDALCILGVVDLDRNPKWTLKRKIESNKMECEKLKNSETQNEETTERLKYLELNGQTLLNASKLLDKFGSFTRLSDAMLWKARILQIKKEKCLEQEEVQSSCQFAQSGLIQSQASQNELQKVKENVFPQMENSDSCNFQSQSLGAVNHIEKIQTQIQAMQESPLLNEETGNFGVVHHFPAPDMSVVPNATISDTPKTEMLNDFRETPSRGSGPRTPARPESARSQNDESTLTPLQIKKERVEASSSPLSQCAFSQSSSPQLPITIPTVPQINTPAPGINRAPSIAPNNTQVLNTLGQGFQSVTRNVPISSNIPQFRRVMQLQHGPTGPPNVTVPFPTNQNYSKVLVNIASKQPSPPNTVINPNNNVIIRNNQLLNVRQVYLPGSSTLTQRLVQPSTSTVSSNVNSFNIYKQTMTSGGSMIVNNTVGQNNYSLSNSLTNTPVLNPQVYGTSHFQQAMQQMPNPVNQPSSNAAFLMQNNKQLESTCMYCAVCSQPATLRCKQCAKVAYCNTTCARDYWHARHKMECKLLSG